MSLVKYFVAIGGDAVYAEQIERETERFVFKNRGSRLIRVSKRTDWSGYFDSFEEAKAWRMKIAKGRIASLEQGSANARADLAQAEALQLREDAP